MPSEISKDASVAAEMIDALAEDHFTRADAERAVAIIADHFGGRAIYIPRRDTLERAQRNAQIVAARERGASVEELASRYRLSTRQVRSILGRS